MKTSIKLTKISKGNYEFDNNRYYISISQLEDTLYGGGLMWFATVYNKDKDGVIVDQKNIIDPCFYLSTMRVSIRDLIN